MEAEKIILDLEQCSPYYRELRKKHKKNSSLPSRASRKKAFDVWWHRKEQFIECYRNEINKLAMIAKQNNIKSVVGCESVNQYSEHKRIRKGDVYQ